MSKSKIALNILILTALIATASLGWLVGHVLRYSIPALWHSPIQEFDPRIKTGYEYESEGIQRLVALPDISQAPQVQVYIGEIQIELLEHCIGTTYYTSLPAKCQSLDGKLVRVGGNQWEFIPLP